MKRYKNSGGKSGIYAYEIGEDSIKVQFTDGAIYLYNNDSAGSHHIAQMKNLAISGRGLNAFINTKVKEQYASRLE